MSDHDNDNGVLDRLKGECRALVGAVARVSPEAVTIRRNGRGAFFASVRSDPAMWDGCGDDDEAALRSLRRTLVEACADKVTALVGEARHHDAAASACRARAGELSRVVAAARATGGEP